jgi:hypothetical protein
MELVRFKEAQHLAHWFDSLPHEQRIPVFPPNAAFEFGKFKIPRGAGKMLFDDPDGVNDFYDRSKQQVATWLVKNFYDHSDHVIEHYDGRNFANIRRAFYYQRLKLEGKF